MDDNLYKYKKMSRFMLIMCVIIGIFGFAFMYKSIMNYYALPIKEAMLQQFYDYIEEVIYGIQ